MTTSSTTRSDPETLAPAHHRGTPAHRPTRCDHEQALVHAARAGNELAFQRLLRRHQPLLNAHARRYFLPGADDDDVAQEARIGFGKAVRGYRPDAGASFRTFAAMCVTRQLASALTAARRRKHLALSEACRGEDAERAWERMPDRADGPAQRALARERRDELAAAGASLSALERAVLARALVGWSVGEAADQLGVSPKSADNALQRARRKVGDWYERQAA
jgi:RNA polymerase sporulation-specific sigma factor